MKLDTFINRPVLSTVISIFIVLLGLIGLVSLPITQYPDLAPPTISVTTTYQGANAQAVLNSVIAPLEESINGAEGMTYMESTATNTGSATINVYFKQGFDPDMAAVDVQNRVAKAQNLLPAEVTQVGVLTQKRQSSMLVGVAVYSDVPEYDNEFIDNYMSINIVPQIKRVNGVGDAMSFGADYSMRIWLKPEVMAQYGLMPGDISAVMAEQNVEAAPGAFGEQGNQSFEYSMRFTGRLEDAEQFRNIVVKALPDGQILRLGDVADIELGRLSYGFANTQNGKTATSCIIFQSAGSNATQVIEELEKNMEQWRKDLPKGLILSTTLNVNDFLFASIHEVIKTLLEAFVLVFLVVFVFLQDFRSTLIPLIAIPVALGKRIYDASVDRNSPQAKAKKAAQAARARLSRAKKALDRGDYPAFYYEMEKSLYSFIASKLKLARKDASIDRIRQEVLARGADPATADELIGALEACNQARYAGFNPAQSETDYQNATRAIVNINKCIKG